VVSGRRRRGAVSGRRAAGHAGADPDRRERARHRVGPRRRRGAVRVDAGERARRGRAGARPRRDTPARVARRGGAGRRVDHLPGRRLPREPRSCRGVPRRGGGPRPPHTARNHRRGIAPRRWRPRAPGVLPGCGRRARRDGRVVMVGRPRSTERASIGRPSRRARVLAALGSGAAIVLGGSSRV
jgi:hypothetical protein